MKMKKMTVILLVLAAIAAGLYVTRQRLLNGNKDRKQTRFLLDTYCTMQAVGPRGEVDGIISRALDRLEEINVKFNSLNSSSPIYDFNNRNIPVSDKEIVDLCRIALEVSKQSGGAFDITVYPLVKLWGYYDKSPRVPGKEQIAGCLKDVDYRHLEIRDGRLIKHKNSVKIDLGAIAKGYAVGEAVKVLKNAGIKSALIDAGGDIYALGKLNGKDWKVGIRKPRGDGMLGVLDATDISMATSGDYERFFMENGVRSHHLLDPKTGYPARGLTSVTVICPDAILSDAWSTALFVMGKDRGMALVEKNPAAEAVMITEDEKILLSSGLKKNLKVLKKGG